MQTQALDTSLSDVGMNQNSSTVPEVSDISSSPAGQIEIPFVPAHKRQTLSNPQNYELKDDTIVVVGQAGTRQRKRKRDKARGVASPSQSKPGTSASTGDHDQEAEEFDYSSVPNLLDNESKREDAWGVLEEDSRRKKKQRQGKGVSMSSPKRHLKKCERHTLCFLHGNFFVFILHETTSAIHAFAPWCNGRQSICESLVLLLIPGLRVTDICSRVRTF